jgi:ABC-type hemin transport system ATPase subunit
MKVTRLELRGFTVFDRADFDFSPGINVLIGENATGKSHVLKVMYAALRSTLKDPETMDDAARAVTERLVEGFRPADDALGHLVRSGAPGVDVMLTADQGELKLTISAQGDLRVPLYKLKKTSSLFLPSREFLAAFERFIAAYDDRDLSFDETYGDLAGALARGMPKEKKTKAAAALLSRLPFLPAGNIRLKDGRFYVDIGDGEREAHLVAEGWRKIATLSYLVANASIKKGTVLFWDEPETGLNPKLVIDLVVAVRQLAAAGVQIFLATHDYLLTQQLSLRAERGEKEPPVRFFSLHRQALKAPVTVEPADTLAEITHNPILHAYARHAEEEEDLMAEYVRREPDGGNG